MLRSSCRCASGKFRRSWSKSWGRRDITACPFLCDTPTGHRQLTPYHSSCFEGVRKSVFARPQSRHRQCGETPARPSLSGRAGPAGAFNRDSITRRPQASGAASLIPPNEGRLSGGKRALPRTALLSPRLKLTGSTSSAPGRSRYRKPYEKVEARRFAPSSVRVSWPQGTQSVSR